VFIVLMQPCYHRSRPSSLYSLSDPCGLFINMAIIHYLYLVLLIAVKSRLSCCRLRSRQGFICNLRSFNLDDTMHAVRALLSLARTVSGTTIVVFFARHFTLQGRKCVNRRKRGKNEENIQTSTRTMWPQHQPGRSQRHRRSRVDRKYRGPSSRCPRERCSRHHQSHCQWPQRSLRW